MSMVRLILFVCVHNAARSQMAEAFFNHYAQGTQYKGMSAGLTPAAEIKPQVRVVMQERGITLGQQHPKLLTAGMVTDAYRIYTLGCIERCPLVPKEKTEDWTLPDPSGKPLVDFRKVRDAIERKIKALVAELG